MDPFSFFFSFSLSLQRFRLSLNNSLEMRRERKGRERWPVNTFIGSLSERNSCVSRCGEKRRPVGESRFKPEAPVIGDDWGASVSRCSKYNVVRQSSREGRVAQSAVTMRRTRSRSTKLLELSPSFTNRSLSIKLTWPASKASFEGIDL